MVLPPYGLSGGSMRFDPACLVLFFDGSFAADPAVPTSTAFRSRMVHERDHLFRHASTSYGFVRYGLYSLLVRAFFQLLGGRDSSRPVTPAGLIPDEVRQAVRALHDPQSLTAFAGEPASRPLFLYLAAVECIQALDGDRAFLNRPLAFAGIDLWEAVAEATSVRGPDPGGGYSSVINLPESLTCYVTSHDPVVPVVADEPFGAIHILEFLGAFIECAQLSASGHAITESTDILGAREYTRLAALFFFEFFGESMTAGQFPAFPLELDAAVDLALWVPLAPDGVVTAGRPLTWSDIQPGFRFLAVCDHLRKSKRPLHPLPPGAERLEDQDAVIRQIQDELCHALGWPTVDELERRWLTFFTGLPARPALHPFALDLLQGPGRHRLATHLLTERMTAPYSTYLRKRTGAVDRELFFPGLISRDGMEAFDRLHWKNDSNVPTNWEEFYAFTGARFFTEGFASHPHVTRDQAVAAGGLLAAVANQFGTDPDAARRYFRESVNLPAFLAYDRGKRKRGSAA